MVAATIAMGLSAGLYYAYSCSVMLGLGRADDRTFVDGMQKINAAILNGWFFLTFAGALVLTAVAALLHFRGDGRAAFGWIVAALVLYVIVLIITMGFNVPLNNELEAAGDAARIADPSAVRERFETAWVRWNLARTVVCTAAFGCLTWALVLHGRVVN
ncbi:DUF1772 domain-containing protein [Actinomadura sp. HBU206391]|uniref:anthrone oxygenase family protein n=1 Tax=Actinomadura sp. HBU206391 TaxID=2731692 RepID=UPI0021C7473B|nr:anthrone oxygenase family protein [Actinomadura sp. HBU206391]